MQDMSPYQQPHNTVLFARSRDHSVRNVLQARELNRVMSLTAPADGAGETDLSLIEKEKTSTARLQSLQLPVEDRIVLDEAVRGLKELEQKVVRLFFFGDLNQTEIARKLGISVNYSSYLLRRAIAKIKTTLDEQRVQETKALHPSEPEPLAAPVDFPTFDATTGVYSGQYLRLRVAEEIARGRRYPTNFALMLVSVQGLLAMPAEVQPQLLAAIGQMLRISTRIVDLSAYCGHGVFGLLLPHTGREARVLGERLCTQIATRELLPPGAAAPIAFAIGYAVFPMEGNTVEVLYSRAERALAQAVKAGPHTVQGVSRK